MHTYSSRRPVIAHVTLARRGHSGAPTVRMTSAHCSPPLSTHPPSDIFVFAPLSHTQATTHTQARPLMPMADSHKRTGRRPSLQSQQHGGGGGNGPPAGFPYVLYHILETEEATTLAWAASGRSFAIRNMTIFCRHVLPKYFKHDKFASVQRQLNLYGFRKVSAASAKLWRSVATHPPEHYRQPLCILLSFCSSTLSVSTYANMSAPHISCSCGIARGACICTSHCSSSQVLHRRSACSICVKRHARTHDTCSPTYGQVYVIDASIAVALDRGNFVRMQNMMHCAHVLMHTQEHTSSACCSSRLFSTPCHCPLPMFYGSSMRTARRAVTGTMTCS